MTTRHSDAPIATPEAQGSLKASACLFRVAMLSCGALCHLQYLLSPGAGLPGRCLALDGTAGHVDIRLRTAIQPQVEHLLPSQPRTPQLTSRNCLTDCHQRLGTPQLQACTIWRQGDGFKLGAEITVLQTAGSDAGACAKGDSLRPQQRTAAGGSAGLPGAARRPGQQQQYRAAQFCLRPGQE